MFDSLFKLRHKLNSQQKIGMGVAGVLLLLALWTALAYSKAKVRPIFESASKELPDLTLPQEVRDSIIYINEVKDSIAEANATEFETIFPILPPPLKVIQSYPSLIKDDDLATETYKSLWLNLKGYFWAILIAIPLGLLIGLLPIFRGMFSKPVDGLRYLPLTALTGVFMAWFGIGDEMKIAFLAFGIIVYLLPVVIQRVDQVKDVYLMTVFTLGANGWQTFKSVYLPSVLSRVSDDIRVLTAISWTYIIVAELINTSEGGVGALIYLKGRFAQTDKVFAVLLIIILIGLIQDRYFAYLDKKLFPYKYLKEAKATPSLLGNTMHFIVLLLSTLYVCLAIWPTGKSLLVDNIFGESGFYIFLMLALIELALELYRKWPTIMDKISGNSKPQNA